MKKHLLILIAALMTLTFAVGCNEAASTEPQSGDYQGSPGGRDRMNTESQGGQDRKSVV